MVGGARVSRKFLLDNGRLQLDPVKQAFGLLTVELILGKRGEGLRRTGCGADLGLGLRRIGCGADLG